MTAREVTIELPSDVYDQLERAARSTHRSLGEVLTEAVLAAVPAAEESASGAHRAPAQMTCLSDAALWRAARGTMSAEHRERLDWLHPEQRHRSLTEAERDEERTLLDLYRETVLTRGRAAVLLKHRGYDVSDPAQFSLAA
jgi:hypothetical protein